MTHTYAIEKDPSIDDRFKQSVTRLDSESFNSEVSKLFYSANYNKMWYMMTQALQNPTIDPGIIKKNILYVFKDKYESIKKSNNFVNFLDSSAYFLHHQQRLNPQEVVPLLGGYENNLFLESVKTKQFHLSDTFVKYQTSSRYPLYQSAIVEFMEQKQPDSISHILPYLTGLSSNSSEILRQFYAKNFIDYDIIKQAIDTYKLDINATGNLSDAKGNDESKRTWAFVHSVFSNASAQNKDVFYQFVADYKSAIDLDVMYSYISRNGESSHWEHKNAITLLWGSDIPMQETLNKLSFVIDNCQINEKHIAQITKILVSNAICHTYSHGIYDTLFNHEMFKSPSIDKGSVLVNILNLDKDKNIINHRVQEKGLVNPVKIIAEKFLSYYPETKTDTHIFIEWATHNKKYSKDTFEYLFTRYEKELRSMLPAKFEDISNDIKAELNAKGISGLKKKTLFSKWFGASEEAVEVAAPSFQIQATELDFNNKLFERVEDSQIKFHIESIKLNAEQFEATYDGTVSKNSHYMIHRLPQFLNKSVEHYLSLCAIEPEEAKENTLPQLKLMNKKTVDILNEVLQEEKEKLSNQAKVQTNIMKNY